MLIGSLSYSVTFSHIVENKGNLNINKSLWWDLSYGVCYGGMGTVVASACNMVGINVAKRAGETISSKVFMRYGITFVIISGLINSLYILLVIKH